VNRVGGSAGEVGVTVLFGDGTAKADVNYHPVAWTCMWADGATMPCVIPLATIAVADGRLVSLTVTLGEASGEGAYLGDPEATSVTVEIQNSPPPPSEAPTGGVASGSTAAGLLAMLAIVSGTACAVLATRRRPTTA